MQNRSPGQNTGPSENDLGQLLRVLLRQKWVIASVATAVAVVAALITFSLPKVYEASTTLEYDPSPPRPLASDVEDVATPAANFLLAKEWYQTQNKIIASRNIASKVVNKLSLNHDPDFMGVPANARAGWKGATKDDAIGVLLSILIVRQERDTRVVRIAVEGTNPAKASLLANAIANAYIDWVIEERMGSTVRAVEWLSGQLDDTSHRLNASEHALHDYRRENNVISVSLADQQNVVTQRIQSYSRSVTDLTTAKLQLVAKLHQLENAYNDDPMRVHASAVSESESITDLRRQYQEALVERDGLSIKYGVNHPEMKRVQAQLDLFLRAAREEIAGLIASNRADLKQLEEFEGGLKSAERQARNEAFELHLREIDYNRLERERANNEKLHQLLLQRTTEANLTRMLHVTPVRLVDAATPPVFPVRPRVGLNLALGALLGLLSGLAVAIFRARMDRSVTMPEQVEASGTSLLGIVPAIEFDRVRYGEKQPAPRKRRNAGGRGASTEKDLVVHTHPQSSAAECCRTIRTNLAFMSPDKPIRALVVTSNGPAEGKSTVAISLAITLAKGGKRVLLIDTDLRRPRIHKVFGVPARHGVTSMLVGDASLETCVQATEVDDLFVLPCGAIPPNPAELLHTPRFAQLRTELSAAFDYCVYDSPPVGVVTDAAIIAPQVDGVLFVAKSGKTTRDALGHSLRQMSDVGAKVIGCVLNEVDLTDRDRYGGYYYLRGSYYYGSDPDDGSGPSEGPDPTGAAPLSPPPTA